MVDTAAMRYAVDWERAGQDSAGRALRSAVADDELGHAWLLVGPRGVGQGELASSLAAAVNCPSSTEGRGCGDCDVCRRTSEGTHTAFIKFEPEGANHLIHTVREDWLPEAYRTLVEGKRRIMRIVAADLMNEATQNAFLKALEEPGPSTVWILEAEDDRALLETIVSRCRRLDLSPWGPEDLSARARELGLDGRHLDGLVRAAGGSPRRLQALAGYECPTCNASYRMSRREGQWQLPDGVSGDDGVPRCTNLKVRQHKDEDRRVVLVRDRGRALHLAVIDHFHTYGPGTVSTWVSTIIARGEGRKRAVAAQHETTMSQLEEDFGVTTGRGWPSGMKARVEKGYRRVEREAQQEAVMECLDDLGSLLRDVLVIHGGGGNDALVNVDHADDIRRDAAHLGSREAIEGLADMAWARQAMTEFNGAPNLQLEKLLLPIAVGVYRATH